MQTIRGLGIGAFFQRHYSLNHNYFGDYFRVAVAWVALPSRGTTCFFVPTSSWNDRCWTTSIIEGSELDDVVSDAVSFAPWPVLNSHSFVL
eukprot:m.416783 g.416783  ORF g.416783 m.416783 type:complete len:91 (-) comp30099_c0_seq1:1057-1329(-)